MRKFHIYFLCSMLLIIMGACTDTTKDKGESEVVEVNQKSGENYQFYVPSENDNIISIIDLPQNKVSAEIKVGERPANMVFINDLEKAFVTHRNGDSIGVIDLSKLQMTKEIKVGIDPHGIALTEDNNEIYVTTTGDQYVYVIDTMKEKVSQKMNLGDGAKTNYPFLHKGLLYVTDHENHLVYVIENEKVINTFKVSGPPMVARTNASGDLLYVASSSYSALEVFNTETGVKVKDIESGDGVTDFMINEEETRLIATNMAENSVSIIDLVTDEIIMKVEDLPAPKHIIFNENESKVYVSLSDTNKVASIDMDSLKLVDQIDVGSSPHGVHLFNN